jgi:heme/copper-type cytochrome/quinol oxidase subunit 2
LVSNNSRSSPSPRRRRSLAGLAAALPLLAATPALAAVEGWRRWWLPENYSVHGTKVDLLFNVIFAVTAAVGIAVFFFLIRYCIKYRYRESVAKAHFTHGNKKLELIWTIIPTILLLALVLWSKGAWDDFRESTTANNPDRARIMVIAEQFKWNVIYPGPDGKFGRYLIYPRTTDLKWPKLPPGDTDDYFGRSRVPGPAYLPPEEAKKYLDEYVQTKNQLGKDFDDPDGKDDDWVNSLRTLEVPKGRPVEIILGSKDVIHSFFLPDYRVKLDAVPGMRGRIYFTAKTSSTELEKASIRSYTVDELDAIYKDKLSPPELHAIIPAANEKDYVYIAEQEVNKRNPKTRKMEKVKEKADALLKDGDIINAEVVAGMKEKGVIKQVKAYTAKRWDLVCEELCGNGHTGMQGAMIVLEPDEYARKYEGKSIATVSAPVETPATPPATTTPTVTPPTSAPAVPPATPPVTVPAATQPTESQTPAPATQPSLPAAPATRSTSPAPATNPTTQPASRIPPDAADPYLVPALEGY